MSLAGWSSAYKRKITFDSTQVDADLTDFVFPVTFGAAVGQTNFDNTDVFSLLGANSKKVAFEIGDTGVQCYGEIVSWDHINLNAYFDVKVPVVLAATDSFLNFYADPAHADNTTYIGDTGSTPAQAVHSNRAFVSHQAQDPSGTAPQILDSSPNAKHGTAYGTMTSGDLVDGLVGKALSYDGTDDYTNHGYSAAHNITDVLTIRAVVKPSVLISSGSGIFAGIVSRQNDPTDGQDTYGLYIYGVTGRLLLSSSGGNLQGTKSSWAAGSTFVVTATYNATGLIGNLFVDGIREIITNNTLDTMAGSTNNLLIGKDQDAARYFPGMIDEVVIINDVMPDAWIKADNAALRDNLITWSISVANPAVLAFVDMQYGDLTVANLSYNIMLYSVLFDRFSFVDQYYGIRLGYAMAMYYGNSPLISNIINQYYGNSPLIFKKVNMEYGNMLIIKKYNDMEYIIPFDIKSKLEMKYSLTGEQLMNILEQKYSILFNNLLRKKIDQIYMLQEGNLLSQVSTSVIIDGNFVNPHHVNVEYSIDSFVASGEIHLASEEEYVKIHQGDDVEITINGETHIFIVEFEPKRSRNGASKTNYIVECISPAIKLSSPWSNTLTCSFDGDTAKNIFEALANPIIVDWKITNFPILDDTLYANNEDRISVMRKIAQSAGAKIQSNPDGSIRVIYRYQTPVKDWNNSVPEYFLTDSRNFITQDETFKHNSGFNKYVVSNATTPEDKIWIEQNEYPYIKAFEVPWKGTEMSLEHSGGSTVITPEYLGIFEEIYPPIDENPEQLEFVAGFATSSKPIYTKTLNGESIPINIEWIRESLGSLTISEDGRIEAEYKNGSTNGYSLAEIRYVTRYKMWKVNNGYEKNVQYILRIDSEIDNNISCF